MNSTTGSNDDSDIVINIDEVEKDFTNAQHGDSSANLGDSFPVKSDTNGSVGNQFILSQLMLCKRLQPKFKLIVLAKKVISLDLEESGAGEIPQGILSP